LYDPDFAYGVGFWSDFESCLGLLFVFGSDLALIESLESGSFSLGEDFSEVSEYSG
jgi:hypothetical protein